MATSNIKFQSSNQFQISKSMTNKPKLLRFAMTAMKFMMGSEFQAVQETSTFDMDESF
jgi:hypothetical protein